MSRISSKGTKPEILVRKYLFSLGFRFRVNVKTLPGKPDIILKKYRTAIFVNGCFWHNHKCKNAYLPKSNHDFWEKKIKENQKRDKARHKELKELGWNVVIIWQCEINTISKRKNILPQIVNCIISNNFELQK